MVGMTIKNSKQRNTIKIELDRENPSREMILINGLIASEKT